jgi:hypothetical protein
MGDIPKPLVNEGNITGPFGKIINNFTNGATGQK